MRQLVTLHRASTALLIIVNVMLYCITAATAAPRNDVADQIREEIKDLEEKIKQGESGRRNAIEQLQDIDRKVELRRRLIVELERNATASNRRVNKLGAQINNIERELGNLSINLMEAETNLEKLRIEAAGRTIYFYKRITGVRLSLLSGIRNLNDLARRRKYFSAIEGFDSRSLDKIKKQRDLIETDKVQREALRKRLAEDHSDRLRELEQYRTLLSSKRSEETTLLNERNDKSQLLSKIENDNNLLRALLEERRQALEEIEREIVRLEQEKQKHSIPEYSPEIPFSKLAGKLISPLKTLTISQPYGPSRHPKLGTITINPGIDFKAKPGEQIYSVANGKITRVAWLRGFGNTIIIANGEGYYTVYSKLEQVFVAEGQVVRGGQILGKVASTGTEAEFHFEVWSKREKQDPMKWLKH